MSTIDQETKRLLESLQACVDAYHGIAQQAAARGDIYTCHRAVTRANEAFRRRRQLQHNGHVA